MAKKVVFLGSCQADILRMIYESKIIAHVGGSAKHVHSAHRLSDHSKVILENADIIVEQVFTRPQLGSLAGLSTNAEIIRFAYVAGHFLWPYVGKGHPIRNIGSTQNPFWGVEFGDERLIRIMGSSSNKEAQIERYVDEDIATTCHADRLQEMHLEMQDDRDRAAEGPAIAALIESSLGRKKLFASPGHPTIDLFSSVIRHVFGALGIPGTLTNATVDGTLALPFSQTELPIHPAIVQHFSLGDSESPTGFLSELGERVGFSEHCRQYVFLNHNAALADALARYRRHAHLTDDEARTGIDILTRALSDSHGSLHGEVLLGQLYRKVGNMNASMFRYRRAVLLAPDSAAIWFDYARAAYRAEDYLLAEEAFSKTLKLCPRAALVHSEMFMVKLKRGQPSQARCSAQTAVDLDPWDPLFRNRLNRVAAAVNAREADQQGVLS